MTVPGKAPLKFLVMASAAYMYSVQQQEDFIVRETSLVNARKQSSYYKYS